jgi:hypothetical protein
MAGVLAAGSASAQSVVFNALSNNGFFTPFSSTNAGIVKYGDSGWLGFGQPPQYLTSITLRLATFGSETPGTTDLIFTLNDGDPSGLLFGPGTQLYTTTIVGVELPAASGDPTYFDVTIPLPGVVTSGGFNNVGWSVGVSNYIYAGLFGFQCSSTLGQVAGFYTNNASFNDGSGWSLFSFGPDPVTGVANFAVQIEGGPNRPSCGLSDIAGPGQSEGADGELTADDIIVFLNRFFANDLRSDVSGPGQNTDTIDGELTADDIIVFLNRFFAGC